MAHSYFDDESFKDMLVSLLIKDRRFLRDCSHLLTDKDFKPAKSSDKRGFFRWTISKLALKHFEAYREPIRDMLRAELIDFGNKKHIEGKQLTRLIVYGKKLRRRKIVGVTSITDKVIQYKKERKKAEAVDEMIALQSRGELTDQKWVQICQKGLEIASEDPLTAIDLFDTFEERVERRKQTSDDRFPLFFIDPLDALVKSVPRGQIGLILAPYKRGKSLTLMHIARALCLQKYNVLYFTLEDPQVEVEDRFDAAITALPIRKLGTMPKTFKERFKRFRRLMRSRIKVIDATQAEVTIPTVQNKVEALRNQGFVADAIIIDYDDELKPVGKYTEVRHASAEIYRSMRKLAAATDTIIWTASQTKRATGGMKVVSGDAVAEDISKLRKVGMALSLGMGDWGDDSFYCHVAAHKFDRQHVGCNIKSDKARMLFYDRDATFAEMRREAEEKANVP